VLLPGLRLRALSDVTVALTGADLDPAVNGETGPMWTTLHLHEGDEFSLRRLRRGLRANLAIGGGFAVEPVLGSRATYVRGGIGGLEGRALRPGDVLHAYERERLRKTLTVPEEEQSINEMGQLRVVFGPQDHLYTAEAREAFLNEPWHMLPEADRMGFRMKGPALSFKTANMMQKEYTPPFIVDDFIPLGGIQTPSEGLIIAMGVEGPSLGGFAKIATVISLDFGVLAQTKPGEELHFTEVEWEQAVEIAATADRRIASGGLLKEA
jgi:antagonist of KipI